MLINDYDHDYDDDKGISTQTHNLYLVQGQCQQLQNEKCRLEKLKSLKIVSSLMKVMSSFILVSLLLS